MQWQSKNRIQKGKTNVEDNVNLKVQIIYVETHPDLKGLQFCLGYGTPVEQTEGTRELKEEGDCLELTIDRQSPSILLTVSFLSCRLDEEG